MKIESKYKDCNGHQICYGDILRLKTYVKPDSENAPKEPYCMLVRQSGEDLMYVSGMDEYWNMGDCHFEGESETELKAFEIFAPANNYIRKVFSFINYDITLTFAEIERLYKETQKRIENKDYGFVPAMMIIFEPEEDFEDYQKVKCCTIHDITVAGENHKVSGKFEIPFVDITDEDKADIL